MIVILPAVFTNIPASYSLMTTRNSYLSHIKSGYIDGHANANFDFRVIHINVSGISLTYFTEYYVPFDDFCRTVNLSNFHNIGNPSVSKSSTMLFIYSMICLEGSAYAEFHGALSTSINNIYLTGNSNATEGLPLKGPQMNVDYNSSGNPQSIIIQYFDPVVLSDNGNLSFTPQIGNYSYTLSFNILTYEEYGIYRVLENITPVSFYFSFEVIAGHGA